MKTTDNNLPIYTEGYEDRVSEGDLFFQTKDNGKCWYRKLIKDTRHTYSKDGKKVGYGLKTTGKWLHEDDFAVKYIVPHKKTVHIVSWDKNYGMGYMEDTFNPETGWRSNPIKKEA